MIYVTLFHISLPYCESTLLLIAVTVVVNYRNCDVYKSVLFFFKLQ